MNPQAVDGQWLDFYALLEVPVNADEDTIRKRIGKVYSEAASTILEAANFSCTVGKAVATSTAAATVLAALALAGLGEAGWVALAVLEGFAAGVVEVRGMISASSIFPVKV